MTSSLNLWILALAFTGHDAMADQSPRHEIGFTERVATFASPSMRRGDVRLSEIDQELMGLPELLPEPFASRYGFRSQTLTNPNEPQWLQIELDHRETLDRIVVMPVHIPSLGKQGEGYGFPLRFKVEVSEDPEMTEAVTVVDYTNEDFPHPGKYPADFKIEPVTGSHIRFTATRHASEENAYFWALEEFIGLSGNRSVTTLKRVRASSRFDSFPNWSVYRSQDGQSALGLPVRMEKSPTRGYLSATTRDHSKEKWLKIDLGAEYEIDEVRLIPVISEKLEAIGKDSFPRGWELELSIDPEFEVTTWRYLRPPTNVVGYPGGCSMILPVTKARGRYLRMKTLELWGESLESGYGIAEIQAYAGNENVAFGKPVTASDEAADGKEWSPDFVTNGYSSQYRLIEIPEHLDLISRRRHLEMERDGLLNQRERTLKIAGLVLGYGGGGIGTLALFGCGWLLIRQRVIRRQALIQLREQIARDLHDDIGTDLSGIVLLSEIGSRQCPDPSAREDFQQILEAAENSSRSMQDIVWLIERGNIGLRSVVARMRECVRFILREHHVSLIVEPPEFRDRELSLYFRRHFFFAFKEALHNVQKHAEAKNVDVHIFVDGRTLCFEVCDDGVGFNPEIHSPGGHGMANLRRRACKLGGTCAVISRTGGGTRIRFEAQIR